MKRLVILSGSSWLDQVENIIIKLGKDDSSQYGEGVKYNAKGQWLLAETFKKESEITQRKV